MFRHYDAGALIKVAGQFGNLKDTYLSSLKFKRPIPLKKWAVLFVNVKRGGQLSWQGLGTARKEKWFVHPRAELIYLKMWLVHVNPTETYINSRLAWRGLGYNEEGEVVREGFMLNLYK